MQQDCNPIWQHCQLSTTSTAAPNIKSVITAAKDFFSSQPSSCSAGYPVWILICIWLTTETGVTIIDWLIYQLTIRRLIEFPNFMKSLPPTGKLILLILLLLQHLIYYIVSICTIVRLVQRERRQETVPMEPYEQV